MALCSIFWLPSTCDRIFSSNLLLSLITRSLEEGEGKRGGQREGGGGGKEDEGREEEGREGRRKGEKKGGKKEGRDERKVGREVRRGYTNSQLSLVTNKVRLHLLVFLCAVLFHPEGRSREKKRDRKGWEMKGKR